MSTTVTHSKRHLDIDADEINADLNGTINTATTATTQSTSDDSTKVSTTAFVKAQGYITTQSDTQDLSQSGNTVSLVDGGSVDISTTTAVAANTAKISYNSAASTKLGTIETSADVTDATNVAAAGAVMDTGNESIAGNKTFTGNIIVDADNNYFTPTANALYTPYTTNQWNAAAPFGDGWHDTQAFNRNYTTTQYTSTDGSTFSSTTLETGIFANQDKTPYTVIASGVRAVRFQFYGVAYSVARYFQISSTYHNPAATCSVLIETSADGSSWSTIHTSTGVTFSASSRYYWCDSYVGNGGNQYVRVTIDKGNTDTTLVKLSSLRILTQRAGDQGKGREDEYPYTWDKDKNVTIQGELTATTLDVNGNADISGALTLGTALAAAEGGTGLTSISTLLNSNVTSISGNAGTATTSSGVTVTDHSTNNINYPVVWHNNANILYDTAAKFTFNPSTGTLNTGPITSTGQITGTELEGTSLDINGNADISGNLSLSGTQKKIILGSQLSVSLPAQGTKMRILTLASLTSCRVYVDGAENGFNQPIVLDIFYKSGAKPTIHRNNNFVWHTHSNDIRFTCDTSGHIYAEKVSYTTGRTFNIRKVEEFKGTVTILDGSTTATGGGTSDVAEGKFKSIDLTSGLTLDGNTITGVDDSGEFTDNDAHVMTSAAINDRFAQINANTTGTAAGLSATLAIASGGTAATNSNGWLNSRITTSADGSLNYDATSAVAVNHDSIAGFVAAEHVDWAGASAGTIHASNYTDTTTNTQLSTEEVQDIVGGMVESNSEDGISVAYQDGDGTLDFTIGTLNQDTTGTAYALNGAAGTLLTAPGYNEMLYTGQISNGYQGLFAATNNANSVITLNRHSGNYESQLGFSSNGSVYYRMFAGVAINTTKAWSTMAFTDSDMTGDTTGNAATVTTNANLTGHITSSGNAAVLGSFTVAQLSTALSNASISGNNTGDQTLPTDFVSAASGGTFGGNVTLESASPVLKIDATGTGYPEILFTRVTGDDQNAKIKLGNNQLVFENGGDPDSSYLFQGRATGASGLSDYLLIEDTGTTVTGELVATSLDINGAADISGNLVIGGTVDGIDIATRDAILTSTTTTAGAALPKAGGIMTGDLTIDKATPRLDFMSNQSGTNVGGRIELNENGNLWVNAQGGKDLWLNWYSPNAQSSKADLAVGDGNSGSAILFVDGSARKVGINDTTPSEALDVTGNILSSGTITGTTLTGTSLDINGSGNLSGTLTIPGSFATTILDGDNVVVQKPDYSSGGWARSLMNFKEHDGTTLYAIGAYGSDNTFSYGYLGVAYNDTTMRWAADKTVTFGGNVTVEGSMELQSNWEIGSNSGSYWQRIRTIDGSPATTNAFNFETRNGSGSYVAHMVVRNDGNVGIGTATPSEALDVVGNIAVSGTVDGVDVAAAGTLATNAMPKSGGAFSGAVTTNNTIDGRQVGADGDKLDTIAENATVDQTVTDSTSTTSSTTVASATAVKAAYDRGTTGITDAADAQTTADDALPTAGGTMSGAIAMGSQNITGAGSIGSGPITSTSTITADTYFESSDAAVVLAPTGAGTCYLRPNGVGSGTGAFSVGSSGKATVGGALEATSLDINGNADITGRLTVGVNDAGHDVIFYGNTANKKVMWDTSVDHLKLYDDTKIVFGTGGAEADYDGSIYWDQTDLVIDSESDLQILSDAIVTGDVTATGAVTAKTYDYISCGYYDNIGTSLHYLPLNGKPSEQASDGNAYTDWVAPCHTTVKSIQIRFTSIIGSGDLTMTVWKDPIGSGTKTSVESETVSVTTDHNNDLIHFLFDGAVIEKGEAMKISIQATGGMTGANTFVTVVLLQDWNDRYTATSQVYSS